MLVSNKTVNTKRIRTQYKNTFKRFKNTFLEAIKSEKQPKKNKLISQLLSIFKNYQHQNKMFNTYLQEQLEKTFSGGVFEALNKENETSQISQMWVTF